MVLELPIIKDFLAEKTHEHILEALTIRFGAVPADLASRVKRIKKQSRLDNLFREAIACPDLEAFRQKLLS